jgi:hypothetical protein
MVKAHPRRVRGEGLYLSCTAVQRPDRDVDLKLTPRHFDQSAKYWRSHCQRVASTECD